MCSHQISMYMQRQRLGSNIVVESAHFRLLSPSIQIQQEGKTNGQICYPSLHSEWLNLCFSVCDAHEDISVSTDGMQPDS